MTSPASYEPGPRPAFNKPEVTEHISLLHKLAAGQDGVLVLCGIEEGKKEPTQVLKFRIGDVDGMVASIMAFFQRLRDDLAY